MSLKWIEIFHEFSRKESVLSIPGSMKIFRWVFWDFGCFWFIWFHVKFICIFMLWLNETLNLASISQGLFYIWLLSFFKFSKSFDLNKIELFLSISNSNKSSYIFLRTSSVSGPVTFPYVTWTIIWCIWYGPISLASQISHNQSSIDYAT